MSFRWKSCITLLALSVPVCAQQNPPSVVDVPPVANLTKTPVRDPDHRIVLDVVVLDKAGKPVTGLHQADFVVLNNKKPQAITAFRAVVTGTPAAGTPAGAAATPATSDPVKIILLVDEVNTGFDHVAYERDAVKKFLLRNGGRLPHPVSMVFFSDVNTEILNGSSRDGNALNAAFNQHETKLRILRRDAGFYGNVDRFQLSIQCLQSIMAKEETTPGRKILIWISPGWPYLSGPRVDLTQKEEQGLFNSIVSIAAALRRSRMTIYSVDPLGTEDAGGFRTIYWEEFVKGVTKPNDSQIGNLALQVIAAQSGGRVLNSNNDTSALIASAAADADAYYSITIDTPRGDHMDDYRALHVAVEPHGLTAYTRTGYYAQP